MLGLLSLLPTRSYFQSLGSGYYGIVAGAIFLILGFLIMKRSIAALVAGLILFGIDSIILMINVFVAGNYIVLISMVIRLAFIAVMVQGIGALKAMTQKK